MFSLTPLLSVSFGTVLYDLLVLTFYLFDFVYCLSPIKPSFVSTLCTWVLTSCIPLHHSLTLILRAGHTPPTYVCTRLCCIRVCIAPEFNSARCSLLYNLTKMQYAPLQT